MKKGADKNCPECKGLGFIEVYFPENSADARSGPDRIRKCVCRKEVKT